MDNKQAKQKFEEIAAHLLPEAARQKAYNRPLQNVNLIDVYGVATGWETEELASARNVETATTSEQVEAALKSRDHDSLLIRKSAKLTLELLVQKLRLCTVPKHIFLEQ